MVVFAAATGLRPSELFALEQGDVDRAAGVVQIRPAYANGRVKQTKTRLSSTRAGREALAKVELSPAGLEPVALALRMIETIDDELAPLDRALSL
jgi:integrase